MTFLDFKVRAVHNRGASILDPKVGPMPPPLDVSAPGALVASLDRDRPGDGRTVLVGWSDDYPDLVVRIDLALDAYPDDEVQAVRQLIVDGAERASIVSYTADGHGGRLLARAGFLAYAAARYGLDVRGVLRVEGDHWFDRANPNDPGTPIEALP